MVILSSENQDAAIVNSAFPCGTLTFQCNICSNKCSALISSLDRETPSCNNCGSTVRMRGIIHSLSLSLFNAIYSIEDFPIRKDIFGFGLSDWDTYAKRLEKKFSYTNTYFHKEPYLDITKVPATFKNSADFIISTDVFEHITHPVDIAFKSAFCMLKPGGVFVFSVPYSLDDSTIEHFPELNEWKLEKRDDWVLINYTGEGEKQEHTDLIFHGGDGQTLEMRKFCERGLLNNFKSAGFVDIKIMKEPFFEHGIYWHKPWSLPIIARKPI